MLYFITYLNISKTWKIPINAYNILMVILKVDLNIIVKLVDFQKLL